MSWINTHSTFWGAPVLEEEVLPPKFVFEPWPAPWTLGPSRWRRFHIWLGDRIERFGRWVRGDAQEGLE